jgi:hypothetical protein
MTSLILPTTWGTATALNSGAALLGIISSMVMYFNRSQTSWVSNLVFRIGACGKWRLWGCYTETDPLTQRTGGTFPTWAAAFGIRKGADQILALPPKMSVCFLPVLLRRGGILERLRNISGSCGRIRPTLGLRAERLSRWMRPDLCFFMGGRPNPKHQPRTGRNNSYPTLEGFPYLPYAGSL